MLAALRLYVGWETCEKEQRRTLPEMRLERYMVGIRLWGVWWLHKPQGIIGNHARLGVGRRCLDWRHWKGSFYEFGLWSKEQQKPLKGSHDYIGALGRLFYWQSGECLVEGKNGCRKTRQKFIVWSWQERRVAWPGVRDKWREVEVLKGKKHWRWVLKGREVSWLFPIEHSSDIFLIASQRTNTACHRLSSNGTQHFIGMVQE